MVGIIDKMATYIIAYFLIGFLIATIDAYFNKGQDSLLSIVIWLIWPVLLLDHFIGLVERFFEWVQSL